jgi:hypothetical protein
MKVIRGGGVVRFFIRNPAKQPPLCVFLLVLTRNPCDLGSCELGFNGLVFGNV